MWWKQIKKQVICDSITEEEKKKTQKKRLYKYETITSALYVQWLHTQTMAIKVMLARNVMKTMTIWIQLQNSIIVTNSVRLMKQFLIHTVPMVTGPYLIHKMFPWQQVPHLIDRISVSPWKQGQGRSLIDFFFSFSSVVNIYISVIKQIGTNTCTYIRTHQQGK